MPATSRTALGADLENFSGFLHGFVNLESLRQITSERLFTIDMLAGIHCVNGNASVPGIVSRNKNGIDIVAFQYFTVVDLKIGIFQAGRRFRPVASFIEEVTGGGDNRVVFISLLVNTLKMILANAEANANNSNCNAVVSADHLAGRRRLILSVDRCFEQRRSSSYCSRSRRRLFYEFPAWHPGRRGISFFFHNRS